MERRGAELRGGDTVVVYGERRGSESRVREGRVG